MEIKNINLDVLSFDTLKQIVKAKYRELKGNIGVEINTALAPDTYKIENGTISASSLISLISGCGRYCRESNFCGSFTLARPVCGTYFASHFNNFYVSAPMEEIYGVIGELALWGQNALMVWYDMHSYTSCDDPDSHRMIERLKLILFYAKKIGMKTALVMLTNESFCTTTDDIRAEWKVQNGYKSEPMGHYHVEICPNKKGGIEKIIEHRRAFLEVFAETKPDFYYVNGYDQGGCTCEKCSPWGIRGNIKAFEAILPLIYEYSPEASVIFSTWGFDSFIDGEWDGLYEAFDKMDSLMRDKISYIMTQTPLCKKITEENKTPGNKPLIGFPEVSMRGSVPWGGFGFNGYPETVGATFDMFASHHMGQFQYSEGIFADANEVVNLCLYSGLYQTAEEAVRAYLRYEISAEHEDELYGLIEILDETLARYRSDPDGIDRTYPPPYNAPHIGESVPDDVKFVICNSARVKEAAETAEFLNKNIKNNWRWRIIYLRAVIDADLMANGWFISEKCALYFDELRSIYHAENSYYCVAPPIKPGHSKACIFK